MALQSPTIKKSEVLAMAGITEELTQAVIIGIRGYEDPGANQVGIYDDCICIVSPDQFLAVNGNTDPSKLQPGVAILQPGTYQYRKGIHGMHHLDMTNPKDKALLDNAVKYGTDISAFTYWAFRQAGDVTVQREGGKLQTDNPSARFWIDIHRGGSQGTSSLGCQTVIPYEWNDFKKLGYSEMTKYSQATINYILINKPTV